MKKSVKVDLSWRVWSLIVGFFILIGFIGLSFASLGNIPNMGHPASDLQKCGANETLKMDSAGVSWICQASSASMVGTDYVIETGKSADGSSWYRKYNSGWIEQGGYKETGSWGSTASATKSFTFALPFKTQVSSLNVNLAGNGATSVTLDTSHHLITGYDLTSFSYTSRSLAGSFLADIEGISWYATGF